MLLHVQNPGIQYALRAYTWEREYRRRVKPAARPYVVLRTMGPISFVFDLSDTQPIDLKDDRVPEIVSNPFPSKGQPPFGALKNLVEACLKLGIEVEERDFATGLAGKVIRLNDQIDPLYIALNSKHTEAQQLGTLAHELGHVFCGHIGKLDNGFWPSRTNLTIHVREFEAEAVAYLVTDRFNLDIGSVQYLADYLKDGEALPNYSLDAILKAVGKIEEMMRGKFRIKTEKMK